ncbi:MAG: hypothetical protein JWO36_4771 [Myxococcales bacterium]|nr:hypothetical protein [Myxococcales bacterium]
MRLTIVAAYLVAGCTTSGSLELELTLPTAPDLRPAGMTTVTVLATSPDMPQTANTSLLSGNSFTAGDLPVDTNVQINVLLRDVSSRLVGVGQAPDPVDIVGNQATKVSIPVRRPFIYTSNGTNLFTFDPTLDPRDPKFQNQLSGLASPQVAVSLGGDRLVVAGPTQLQVIDTATHKVTGTPIALPAGATVADVAAVPGTHRVAVAHSLGISIVDIDTAMVQTAMVGAIDRVTVGPTAAGKLYAYGLVGRASPASSALASCTGSSSLVAVSVDSPAVTSPHALGQAVSGIAAASDRPMVFATLPCVGQVARIDGDPTTEISTLMLTKISSLDNAAVLAVAGDRVLAAGTKASTAMCSGGACGPTTKFACPETNGNRLSFVTEGAHMIVQAIPLDASAPIVLELPERKETMIDQGDPAMQHAQVLHSLGIVPLDMVVLPGGQYVSIITKSTYYIERLDLTAGTTLLPCMLSTTGDWLLLDLASSSIAQRVRTQCMLTWTPANSVFAPWSCETPSDAEKSTVGDYMPTSVGALFGVR